MIHVLFDSSHPQTLCITLNSFPDGLTVSSFDEKQLSLARFPFVGCLKTNEWGFDIFSCLSFCRKLNSLQSEKVIAIYKTTTKLLIEKKKK
jgi:hypothetical protein